MSIDPRSLIKTVQLTRSSNINKIITSNASTTGTGAASDSIIYLSLSPFAKWRVVNCGFRINAAGASTVAELVVFGMSGDAVNENAFASFTQDTTAGKNWAANDIYSLYSQTELADPLASTNGGAHTVTEGASIGVWQTVQCTLTVTKKTVASSTGSVNGWMLLEIEI